MVHTPAKIAPTSVVRRRWRVRGQVQGVGFRPFVWRLAREHGLTGLIRNDCGGVLIEAQGAPADLEALERDLHQPPPLASITEIAGEVMPRLGDEREFRIVPSENDALPNADVAVDSAVCPECLAELLGQGDRRRGYALINCTNCGPRYSIVRKVPYDRPNTTMAGFAMCPRCRGEYENPADRRFHAQPIACHECGPKIDLVDPAGRRIKGVKDPLAEAAKRLLAGEVLAIKGIGGFHLAARADDEKAVARLRKLKHRDAKPFAVMCASLDAAKELVELSPAAEAALRSPASPIILARKRPDATKTAAGVAPGNHRLGVMLPYTPIQHLLFAAIGDSSLPLVMTSGNLSDEPLAISNEEAVARLGMLCDAMLWHDRPIERCIDDSVLVDLGQELLPVRRARGYVPTPIELPLIASAPGLCVGAELKNTVAVVRGASAILSQHMGDLNHPLAYEYFKRHLHDLCELFGVKPKWIAHDLHPLYQSRVYAEKLAEVGGVELIGVQHHHAHAAAVMAEHGITDKTLAVVCDGVGYGDDGTSWGGELLLADLASYERIGRLRPLLLAGGDAAAKDTRRCGLALLQQAYGDDFAEHPIAQRLVPGNRERQILAQMLRRGLNCTPSSGAGRVFDGVAAILGLCQKNEFEAQAAMALEALASGAAGEPGAQLARISEQMEIDLAPVIRTIAEAVSTDGAPVPQAVPQLAAWFHDQFAQAWASAVSIAVEKTGVKTVCLSGGVFCNELVKRRLCQLLESRGLRVLRHRIVPANDGGISLGQAAIAVWRTQQRKVGA